MSLPTFLVAEPL